jgi:carboxypeptidase family protein/TonB-dependent receptor-like protein
MNTRLRNYRLAILWIASGATAIAQLTTADIAGSVRDPQGLSVASAHVSAVNRKTDQRFSTETNAQGGFLLRALPPGDYSVFTEASGFKSSRQENVSLSAAQIQRLDIRLDVGSVSESVTISAAPPPVDTQTGTLGTLVDTKRLDDLPLQGRNILSLAALTPGVTRASVTNSPSSGQQSINVDGNRASATNITLDGASMYYAHRGAALVQPPPDAVQEVRIITNGEGADFKRGSAAITVITRNGTNEFHGALWDYFRNDALNARSFFAAKVSKLRYNQFGGAAGGPIKRNKAFFFGSYQGFRNPADSLASSAFPPTAAQRSGDFSSTAGKKPIDSLTGQPFPNGIIPQTRFDPIALKLLSRIPLPNRANGQYVVQDSVSNSDKMFMGRVDYDFTANDRTNIRYFYDKPTSQNPFPNGGNVDQYASSVPENTSQNWNLAHMHTFTPNLVMNLRASVTRFVYVEANNVRDTLASLGSNFVVAGGPGSLPYLSVTGSFIAGAAREGARISDTDELAGDLSWFKGKHEIRMGADVQRMRFFFGNADRSNGEFYFDGSITGNSVADFLLGRPVSMWQQSYKANDTRDLAPGFYVQDRWRVTPRLSLTLGLRWDIFTNWRMINQGAFSLVPGAQSSYIPKAPVGVLYDHDNNYPYRTDWINPSPRVGFAYDLSGDGKTSIRGAYGISYDPLIGQLANQAAQPFGYDINTTNTATLSYPYKSFGPVPFNQPINLQNPVFSYPISMAGSFVGKIVTPYAQNMNFTIERQVARGTLVQASYVGSLTRHEGVEFQQNPAIYIPRASTTQNTDTRRIYAPIFGDVTGWSTDGNASYNALQLRVARNFSKGVTFDFAYSHARAIDESSRNDAANNWTLQNTYDRRGNRGLGDYQVANRLVGSWVWEVPFLSKPDTLTAKILGGWKFAGIAAVQDGMPFTVTSGKDNSLTGVNADRPNVLGNPVLSTDRPKTQVLTQFFDTTQYVANLPGQYGNSGRNTLIGPGLVTFDLSMGKHFSISENQLLEFRCDAFNAFNRANFANPNSNLSSGKAFGQITSAGAGRTLQLALRFQF